MILNGAMSTLPRRGFVPHRQRHHRHQQHHHQQQHHSHNHRNVKHYQDLVTSPDEESEIKRPKVNPIFLWASQHDQKIVEVRCEDYDKRNRIKLTKTAQGWRSIPRTASNTYAGVMKKNSSSSSSSSEKENGPKDDEQLRRLANGDLEEFGIKERINGAWIIDDDDNDDDDGEKEEMRKIDEERKKLEMEELRKLEELKKLETKLREERKMEELRKLEKLKELEEKLERQQFEELQRMEHLRKLEELMISGNRNPELKNRSAIRKRSEIRRNDELRKKESEIQERRKNEELRKRAERKKRDVVEVREKLKVRHKKKKKEHVVLGYSTIDGINAWKMRKRRNDHHRTKKRKRISEENDEIKRKKPKNIDFDHLMQPRVVLEQLQLTEMDEGFKNRKDLEIKINSAIRQDSEIFENSESREQNSKCLEPKEFLESTEHLESRENLEELEITEHLEEAEILEELQIDDERDLKDEIERINEKELTEEEKLNDNILNELESKTNENITEIKEFENENNETDIESVDHSSDDDFQDILKMLDSTSFTSSKLVLSLKSAKILEELELSLNGIEDDVEKNEFLENNNFPPIKEAFLNNNNNNNNNNEKAKDVEIFDNEVEIIEATKDKDLEILETDSSRILKALRNTPGLSVSVTKSRSPDSQMEREIRIDETNRLSIVIPEKLGLESPESTVQFPRLETVENSDDDDEEEDTQIMDDKKNKERKEKQFLEMKLRRLDKNSNPLLQIVTNEAQAKRAGEEIGFRIHELMMDDSKSNSAVSPQPSGIPCSPILRRSSSAYLERLLPSPPCSVTCSEDAKNDLTLKGILSSPSCLEVDKTSKEDQNQILQLLPRQQEINNELWKSQENQQQQQQQQQQIYQSNGRSIINSAQNAFLIAQQRAQVFRYQQQLRAASTIDAFLDPTISDNHQSPATQLRQLLKTMGHLIPDPLLVPRHCLPGLAAAPSIEIPKLLTSRPDLRLPEALNRPELLRDPDLLVISIAHLQFVLDQGQDTFGKTNNNSNNNNNNNNNRQSQGYSVNPMMENVNSTISGKKTINNSSGNNNNNSNRPRPKLSCKPIGTLMPAPIDLSRNRKNSSYSSLLRVRTGLLKQESEVSSTASNIEEHHQLWHPLFSRQKRPQQQQQQQQQQQHQQNYQATWHTTTFAS
ncbi:putative leucine-rich repeat-containing protein DDB_G0290503 [Leptopilina boulardi]|uniref:putative leucine-rich repeat-containing protein DDB_G0290503 n=1 Tax=Leptopilina boulardi TaxID=63433 RepID=UPI0021F5D119|nr:putative leucine-rich repeat-containing protein DDB_G0290503 [Leptopilina boulardi]